MSANITELLEDLVASTPQEAHQKLNEMVFTGQIRNFVIDRTSGTPSIKVVLLDMQEVTIGQI